MQGDYAGLNNTQPSFTVVEFTGKNRFATICHCIYTRSLSATQENLEKYINKRINKGNTTFLYYTQPRYPTQCRRNRNRQP